MTTFRIAVIAGDGIGREVIPAGMAALEAERWLEAQTPAQKAAQ